MKFLDYEIEIPNEAYMSMGWNMWVSRNATVALRHKEMAKSNFISNPIERRERQRQILADGNDNELGVSGSTPEIPNWQEVGFNSLTDFFNLASSSMFYNVSAEVSRKRHTEVEAFVMEILKVAKHEASMYNEICYLIDQQFEFKTGVFDHAQSDLAFQKQYNQLIYDILEKRIWEVWKTQPLDPLSGLDEKKRKPLRWKATAISLGTLFGVLYDNGVIEGNKVDIHRVFNHLFGISEETTKAAMNHKTNNREGKVYYDPETVKLLQPWIDHLKTTKPKTTKKKVAKKNTS